MRFLILAFFLTSLMFAADPTGSISGKVVDPSGSAVAGAKLRVASQATGLTREATSASDGGFLFPLLPSGTYDLAAEAAGFRGYVQHGVVVAVNVTINASIALQLGSVSESVSVEANAEQVETRSG